MDVSPELFGGFDGRGRPVSVDLEIENREPRSVAARLLFQGENGFEASAPLVLDAGEILPIADALSSWLRAPEVAGTLTLEAAEDGGALPLLSGRVYPRRNAPEAAARAQSPGDTGASRWIVDLSQARGETSEIVAVNRTASPLAFEARLQSSGGTLLSLREGLSIPAGESRAWSLEELFGFVEGEGLTLRSPPPATPRCRRFTASSSTPTAPDARRSPPSGRRRAISFQPRLGPRARETPSSRQTSRSRMPGTGTSRFASSSSRRRRTTVCRPPPS
jgi:hypothetical protein